MALYKFYFMLCYVMLLRTQPERTRGVYIIFEADRRCSLDPKKSRDKN